MKYLYCDTRALSLMRMLMAALIMLDLLTRMTDLEAFYANSGAVPLTMLFEHSWNKYFISLHAISGMWQVQWILLMLSFLFSVLLFIGYRTRLFTVLSWFMMLSLHNRNGLILQGGDDLMRMTLFWAIFLPWGARYSCDSILDKEERLPVQLFSVATVAYLLQICYIYTGSALLKGREWNTDFTAVYYAYSLDQIAYPITRTMYYYPELLRKLTILAYYFELLVPILFFIPLKHAFFRNLGVLSIILFHGFNLSTLFIGLFPVIGMVTVIGLLPSTTMDTLECWFSGLKATARESFVFFTGHLPRLLRWRQPIYTLSPFADKTRTASLIFLTVFTFDWNFSNLSFINNKLSDDLRFIGYTLRLDQSWGMFAPGVLKDDGWYVFEGITKDGRHMDLLHPDKPLTYNKPDCLTTMFKNDRWRKYLEYYMLSDFQFMRGYFCNYYKRVWNETHPENQIVRLQIIYMSEFTKPDYQYSKPEKNTACECWE